MSSPRCDSAVLARLIESPSDAAVTALDLDALRGAVWHGVAPLIHAALTASGHVSFLGNEVRRELRRQATEAIAIEAVRHDHLRLAIEALGRAGVEPIVFKGAAVAATHYRDAWLRPRGDTDLLIAVSQREHAHAALAALGFRCTPRPAGDWITHQARHVGEHGGITIAYDVHWRLSDPNAFAHVLTHEEIRARGRVLPHVTAHVPADEHALLIACVHRAAHHYGTEQLILFYDIHRIAGGLTPEQWSTLTELACSRRLRAVTRAALERTRQLFATAVPDEVLARLRAPHETEPTARFLDPSLRKVDLLHDDFRSAPGLRERLRLLRQHLFPAAHYIKAMYGVTGRRAAVVLPFLYLRRILQGSIRWLRPLRASAPVELATRP